MIHLSGHTRMKWKTKGGIFDIYHFDPFTDNDLNNLIRHDIMNICIIYFTIKIKQNNSKITVMFTKKDLQKMQSIARKKIGMQKYIHACLLIKDLILE